MNHTAPHWRRRSLVAAAAGLFTACAGEAPLAPDRGTASAAAAKTAAAPAATARNAGRNPDLGSCTNLQPEGVKLAYHVYATGVQIYRWSGTSWVFVAPEATLSADAGGHSTVGIHYAGPTWESVSGSKVVGAVALRCTPDATAIPWLLLRATSAEGPGIFHRVAYIQRLYTVGGLAPSTPGTVVGEIARVPYTTEYFFYRAQ